MEVDNMAPGGKSVSEEKVIPTVCASHCGGSCLLKVHVKDGIITRIETDDGEEPQLRACLKGRAQRQRIYAPDRLKFPLKRVGARGEGKFERISWDEALDTIAGEWKRIRDTYGPRAIVYDFVAGDICFVHTGGWMAKLINKFGGCTRTWGNPSFQGAHTAVMVTYGSPFTNNMRDDLPNSRLIIMWGWDPANTISGVNTSWYLAQAREKGTKIISVDPRYTDSAAILAHQWIPIRPGSDTAMVIAMAYVMIVEKLYDQNFINTYTIGFDKFRDYVLGHEDGIAKSPDWAEEITGVPAKTIETLAREYATTKPAALIAGIGPGRTAFGEQYHRATITLAAMTGNIGIHGGDAGARAWEAQFGGYPYGTSWFNGFIVRLTERDALPQPWHKMSEYRKNAVHRADLAEYILKGNCKMLILILTNCVNQFPNVNKTARALQMPEFIVVEEQFMTPTAKFADIILPGTTFMERNDITMGVGLPFVGLMNKVIDPLGESKSPIEIATELAQRMGIDDLPNKEEEEVLREMLEEFGITDYEQFRGEGVRRIKLTEPHVAFGEQIADPRRNPFPTPSGKIEIYSQQLADLGKAEIPPIPKYIAAKETRRSSLAKKYPLELITPHFRKRALSQFDNTPWLKELGGQEVWINSQDAAARDIGEGDMVRVFNDRGELLIRAKVTERIIPGTVSIPQGAWYNPDKRGLDRGACANVLTSDEHSPVGAFLFNANLVEMEKYRMHDAT
jgi:anaerobic dimethyl sulfoxide reductase subunit A